MEAGGKDDRALPRDLVERVLARLGLGAPPDPDDAGLSRTFESFARGVPFDNVRKRIHLAEGSPGPLPGDDPASFLEDWLRDGTGGTCWAIAGAFHALLVTLGFRAERALSTMLVGSGDLPPNHGTVVVTQGGAQWLVDPVMKSRGPLRLDPERRTSVDHPARGVVAAPVDAGWIVTWWPLHVPEPLDCRIDRIGASAEEFRNLHAATRGWSPFNYQLYVRVVRDEVTEGISFGMRAQLDARGTRTGGPVDEGERRRYLVDVVGMSEAIARRLPADAPTPPPPGSRTAAVAGESP